MIILQDYWCEACNRIERDRMWASASCVENPAVCSFCGGRAHIRYCKRQGDFGYNPRLYGDKPIPTLGGARFENRSEKLKYLAKKGLSEASDLIGGSRTGYIPPGMDEPAAVPSGSVAFDHMPTDAELDAISGKIITEEINQGSRKYHAKPYR